jgi:hypothetical protein
MAHGGTSTIGQQAWTARRVSERLIQAFRELPDHPVYHEHGRLRIEGTSSPDAAQVLQWPTRFLEARDCRDPSDRLCSHDLGPGARPAGAPRRRILQGVRLAARDLRASASPHAPGDRRAKR